MENRVSDVTMRKVAEARESTKKVSLDLSTILMPIRFLSKYGDFDERFSGGLDLQVGPLKVYYLFVKSCTFYI